MRKGEREFLTQGETGWTAEICLDCGEGDLAEGGQAAEALPGVFPLVDQDLDDVIAGLFLRKFLHDPFYGGAEGLEEHSEIEDVEPVLGEPGGGVAGIGGVASDLDLAPVSPEVQGMAAIGHEPFFVVATAQHDAGVQEVGKLKGEFSLALYFALPATLRQSKNDQFRGTIFKGLAATPVLDLDADTTPLSLDGHLVC
jgi:hypothetical protein